MNNSMNYLKKLDEKFNQGFEDGVSGTARRGLMWGRMLNRYLAGYNQGQRMRLRKSVVDAK